MNKVQAIHNQRFRCLLVVGESYPLEKFKEAMAEDFVHEARAENPDRTFDQHIFDAALRDIVLVMTSL